MTRRWASRLLIAAGAYAAVACAPPPRVQGPGTEQGRDSVQAAQLIPAGYGSLRQDDIAVQLRQFGLQVRAIPLDESVIRVLSPDSYRAMRDLLTSQSTQLDSVGRRWGLARLSVWY